MNAAGIHRIARVLALSVSCSACSVGALRPEAVSPGIGAQPGGAARHQRLFLYVGGWDISKYALGSSQPLRTAENTDITAALALDRSGNLSAVEGYGSFSGQIQAYDARNLKLVRTIRNTPSFSSQAVTDRSGYLFVADRGPIWVYAPGGRRLIYRIRHGAEDAHALVFDASGNLYAGNRSHLVNVFVPTQKPGHMALSRSIRDGVDHPQALAVSPAGDLFVANFLACNPPCGKGAITVYPPGGAKPILKITDGVEAPLRLALDSTGRLYVANASLGRQIHPRGWVSVYAPGASRPMRKIIDGVRGPIALALDPSDNLYVANAYDGSVTVYSPGGATLLYRITKGISNYADALAIGAQ
jgi:DNA-binding beta-propeller fold protein YncE